VHEHSHFKFWKQHSVLGENRQIKEQFDSTHGLKNEQYALTEERNFLNQLSEVVSQNSDIILFRVKFWDNFGQPSCEGIKAEFPVKENITQRVNMIENTLKQMSSKEDYSMEMVEHSKNTLSQVSSILKLDLKKENYPVVEIEI
jgi:hypothetical protein